MLLKFRFYCFKTLFMPNDWLAMVAGGFSVDATVVSGMIYL